MKVTELKAELAARSEPVSGPKPWLRRRLHAAIMHKHLEEEYRVAFEDPRPRAKRRARFETFEDSQASATF